MKRAVDILRSLRAEAPDVPSNDYNRGYHEALYELEERLLEAAWDEGIETEDEDYRGMYT